MSAALRFLWLLKDLFLQKNGFPLDKGNGMWYNIIGKVKALLTVKQDKSRKELYKMKRIICFILALVMVSVLLVACKDNGDDPSLTTDATTGDQNLPSVEGDKLFDASAMKEKNKAENKVMYVLNWNAEHVEFEVTEDQITIDEVNAAVYERDNQVKNSLGLSAINYHEEIGSTGNENKFVQYVERVALNNDAEVDVIATYSKTAGLCAQKGFYLPVNYYDKYINLDNSWYPKQFLDEVRIKDNIYFVSGDISTNLLFMTYCFIFNKELMNTLGIDYNDYYDMVESGKWTNEEMYKLVEGYYDDANGNGYKDIDDHFGLRTCFYHMDALYTSAGLKIVEVDHGVTEENKKNLIFVSPDYGSQKSVDLNDRLGELMTSNFAYADSENVAEKFAQTRKSLSMITRIRDIGNYVMKLDEKLPVGVLPMPKYNEAQEDYRCVAGNPITLWSIFSGNMDLEREEAAAGFIEYMGYFATENTTEAVFADIFLGRFSDQPDDANQFNIIRRTTAFDIGRVFALVVSPGSTIIDHWTKCAQKGSNWTSVYNRFVMSYKTHTANASEDFWKLNETLTNPYENPYEN